MDNDFATGYALGADSNGASNNGWCDGNGGWLWILVIFALLGWGGNGFGGFGGNGGGYVATAATQADIQRGFDNSAVISKLDGLSNGLCDGFYAVNNGMLQGFNGVNTAMLQGFNAQTIANLQGQNALATQLAQCCCENRQGQADIKYAMASDTCAIQNTMNGNTRDILDNQNANTRAILDYLCQDKISTLQSENQSLRLAASQADQNAVLRAAMEANTAEILRRAAPLPIPSYQVANPYTGSCGYGCGYNSACC
jgi:hypothetical protein